MSRPSENPVSAGDDVAISHVLDYQIDPSKSMFERTDWSKMHEKNNPAYSTKAVATVFFQRSDHWIRWLEQNGRTFDPSTNERFDVERDSNNNRRYRLPDIERLAKLLHSNGSISFTRLMITLRIVWLVGVGYEAVSID